MGYRGEQQVEESLLVRRDNGHRNDLPCGVLHRLVPPNVSICVPARAFSTN
jgi:hypothetical protein